MVVVLLFIVMPFIFSLIGSILAIVSARILHNELRRKKKRFIHIIIFIYRIGNIYIDNRRLDVFVGSDI